MDVLDTDSEEEDDDSESSPVRLAAAGLGFSLFCFLRRFLSSASLRDVAMLSFFCFLIVALW